MTDRLTNEARRAKRQLSFDVQSFLQNNLRLEIVRGYDYDGQPTELHLKLGGRVISKVDMP